MPINSLLYPQAKVPTPFEVSNSLRFDDGSRDYLNKHLELQIIEDKGTISVWIKRSDLSRNLQMFASSYR